MRECVLIVCVIAGFEGAGRFVYVSPAVVAARPLGSHPPVGAASGRLDIC